MANPELVSVGISAAGAVGLGLITTAATRASVRRIGFVAKPRVDRWHQKPTGLAGGVGIFLAFVVVVLATSGDIAGLSFASPLVRVLLGATAMFVLGLVDDVYHLRPYTKLIGQLLVAAATVVDGPALPWTPYLLVNQSISVFWIVGLTNAVNLLDNMDGLAAGSALVVAAFQAAFFWVGGQPVEAAICAALAGSLLGFLAFNWNPASIFMGDCGSLFLGYTLSVLALNQSYGRGRSVAAIIIVPVMVMLLPIFDTTFVTITRLLRGKPVSQGGRDHTSHRLVTLGLSERRAVTVLLLIGVLGGTVGLSARVGSTLGIVVGAPLLLVALVFVAIHLVRGAPVTGERDGVASTSRLLRFGQFAYKRRIFEVLLDATLAMVSIVTAFWLRFDGRPPLVTLQSLTSLFPLLVATKVVALLVTGGYGGVWRYVSLPDIWRLMRGCLLGSVMVFAIGTLTHARELSRGALIMDGILFAVCVLASRVGFRVMRTWAARRVQGDALTPVLLWGAGDAGASLLRRLLDEPERGLVPVGFIDDDATKLGHRIHGLPVLGSSDDIPALVDKGSAAIVVVCSSLIPSARVEATAARVGAARVRRVRFELEDATTALIPTQVSSS